MNNHYLYFRFLSLICVYTIWFDLIWFDLIWFDLIWFDLIWFDLIWFNLIWLILFLFIRNGSENHLNSLYFFLSYLTLLYLILFILNNYVIWCYLCINMWCDTQCCWLTKNIYYYSIITLISVWYDSSTLCCCQRSFGSCKSPTRERSWHWS